MYNTRRQQLDHERYMNHREERLRRQREYYRKNKEEIRRRFLQKGTTKIRVKV